MSDKPYMTLDFKAKVEDCSVFGLSEHFGVQDDGIDIDTPSPSSDVEFELQPDANNSGIRSISPIITSIKCSVNWEVSTDDLTDDDKKKLIAQGGTQFRSTIEGTIEVDSNKPLGEKTWDVDCQLTWESDGQMLIEDVQIDFSDMTIIVSN